MYVEIVHLPQEYEIPTIATAFASPPSDLIRQSPLSSPREMAHIAPEPIRIGFIIFRCRTLGLFIICRTDPSFENKLMCFKVRAVGVTMQLISVMIAASQTPMACVILGVAIFVFSITESGCEFML